MAKQIQLSKEGYTKLTTELEYLKTVKRKEVAQAIAKARAYGDLSENSEYDEAKNEQGLIENRIANLEETVANAVVLDDSDVKTDKVGVGNLVTIYDFEHDIESIYRIVGSSDEADPFAEPKCVSDDSPIGRACMGARKGDSVTIETPKGVHRCTIVSIAK